MVLLIRKESDNLFFKVILAMLIIIVIIIILYLLWRYVSIPISEGKFLGIRVTCSKSPETPKNLGGHIINGSSIKIQWDKTPQTDSYILHMGNKANFSTTAAERTVSLNKNFVTLTNLTPGQHYFKIIAVNICGQSQISSEIKITTTEWPSSFKICKIDDPTLCLLMQSDGAYARLSKDCPNNQCSVEYAGKTFIRTVNRNLCLFSNRNSDTGTIEFPVESKFCADSTTWITDPSNNRVISSDGLCLGANTQDSAIVYNTQCNLISNSSDPRYQWTIV